jgi:mycothiol synthase
LAAPIATRAFRRGIDDDAWLALNAAAFADHPDQGGWTQRDLDARLDAAWFDPDGFLIHDGDGERSIDAFCWTKVHSASRPPMGEIFVIGVHPSAHGRGLGRAMTLAGLADLCERRGMAVGMLYVESDNLAARSLYDSLGFARHHDDVSYELP